MWWNCYMGTLSILQYNMLTPFTISQTSSSQPLAYCEPTKQLLLCIIALCEPKSNLRWHFETMDKLLTILQFGTILCENIFIALFSLLVPMIQSNISA